METPFALNSLTLRQRARWRIRSQVSWRKTCKPSALYTIGIHAFFINLRNPIPLQIHESPPFTPHPVPKSVFVPPRLWQSKRKKPNFFCKERLWVYNYVMHKTKIIQKDYSLSSMNYQLKLPFELEVLIPDIIIANLEKDSRASCTATKLPSYVQLCHPPEAHLSRGF